MKRVIWILCMVLLVAGLLAPAAGARPAGSPGVELQGKSISAAPLSGWTSRSAGRTADPVDPQDMTIAAAPIHDFGLFSPLRGWLWIGGGLYRTADVSATWTEITPPGASTIWAVDFLDSVHGWVVSSPPAGDVPPTFNLQLSTSPDGGLTWTTVPLGFQPFPDLPGLLPAAVYLSFSDAQTGRLVFKLPASANFDLGALYNTLDGGLSWQAGGMTALNVQSSMFNVERSTLNVQRSNTLTDPVMIDSLTGWSLETTGSCDPTLPKAQRTCTQTQRLLRTTDGGQTWTALALPLDSQSLIPNPPPSSSPELLTTGQGIDKCEIPSLASLQTWWNDSPYAAVNLYIGGSLRACSNKALTYSYLSSIDRQGWTMIPTWVGRQAACSSYYSTRMSYDPAVAYDQGVQEAADAVAVAANLKLWNQVLYYDLESFDTDNTSCLEAAKAFINGWTEKLHAAGYVAGVYGSPCTSGLPDFWGLPNTPDAVWIAHWIYSAYNANATVLSTACGLSSSYWANHQRLRQYAGGHNETWGGVTLNIDSNVLDGVVAPSYGQPVEICPRPGGAPGGAILYNSAGYACAGRQAEYGYYWRNTAGFYNVGGFFQDRASALYVPAGQSVLLYEGLNRAGGKVCLSASTPDFAGLTFNNGVGLNDQVSSFELFSGTTCGGALNLLPDVPSGAAAVSAPPLPDQPDVGTPSLLDQPTADTTPPAVTVTSLAKNGYLNAGNSAPVQIQATLQDSGSGISHAQFFAGYGAGSAWAWQNLGWDTNGADGWSMNWDASALSEQADIGVYVFAWDQAGNGTGAPVLHLTLDRTPPSSALTALPASLESTRIPLAWTLADNLSGVASFDIQVQIDGAAWGTWLSSTDPAQTSAAYYAQLGHTYAFRMRAVDKAGNAEPFPQNAETTTHVNACSTDSFEPDNTLAAAKALSLGESQAHTICGLGDVDWLRVELSAGQAYQFATANLAADTDTLLGLYDANGNRLAENDDVGPPGRLDSRLFYRAAADEVVYLRIEHTDPRLAGNGVSYQVSVEQVRLDYLPIISK